MAEKEIPWLAEYVRGGAIQTMCRLSDEEFQPPKRARQAQRNEV